MTNRALHIKREEQRSSSHIPTHLLSCLFLFPLLFLSGFFFLYVRIRCHVQQVSLLDRNAMTRVFLSYRYKARIRKECIATSRKRWAASLAFRAAASSALFWISSFRFCSSSSFCFLSASISAIFFALASDAALACLNAVNIKHIDSDQNENKGGNEKQGKKKLFNSVREGCGSRKYVSPATAFLPSRMAFSSFSRWDRSFSSFSCLNLAALSFARFASACNRLSRSSAARFSSSSRRISASHWAMEKSSQT